jgi:cadmium resistance protein CadD (predicted permease)
MTTVANPIAEAATIFAVTNVDDILFLALYFGRAHGDRAAERRIVLGQYVGFCGILAVSLLTAFGVGLLPEATIAYLGLIPIALGIRAGVEVFRHRNDNAVATPALGTGTTTVAAITFSNGGDNIGVYVPVFATVGAATTTIYVAVFMLMVAVWCFAGRYFATRPAIARILARWGHIVLPVVLITIGTLILVQGGAFGL